METGARRLQKFAELISSILLWQNDFERRLSLLHSALSTTRGIWSAALPPADYNLAISALSEFADYKKTSKRQWGREKQELGALYSNIQTKLRTYGLATWEPAEGKTLGDLENVWASFLMDEGKRSRAINARIREWVHLGLMPILSADTSGSRRICVGNSHPRQTILWRSCGKSSWGLEACRALWR
jgi:hypothetical protein